MQTIFLPQFVERKKSRINEIPTRGEAARRETRVVTQRERGRVGACEQLPFRDSRGGASDKRDITSIILARNNNGRISALPRLYFSRSPANVNALTFHLSQDYSVTSSSSAGRRIPRARRHAQSPYSDPFRGGSAPSRRIASPNLSLPHPSPRSYLRRHFAPSLFPFSGLNGRS